jgi:mannitol/fructose-specific phosphotransferase system IIA component (Ntr-type)
MRTTQITNPIEAHDCSQDDQAVQGSAPEEGPTFNNGFQSQFDLRSLAEQFGFVVPESVLPELDVQSKDVAIRTMVGSLADAGAIPESEQENIASAVLRREELASTGIGRGVAIPHTRHEAVDRVVATMAYSREGIEFDSLDGLPVHLLLLLVSPSGSPSDHVRALETVSRCLADQQYRVWRRDQRHSDDDD